MKSMFYETVKYYRNLIDGLNIKSGTEKLFNRGYEKGYFYGKNKNTYKQRIFILTSDFLQEK